MTVPENNHDINKDNPAVTLEALGNAARAYASLAPNLAVTGGFPPIGVDASALLVNPAAAVAAVAAAAAKHLAAQGQGTVTPAPPAISASAAPSALAAPYGHPHAPTTQTPSPAAALAAASALLPNAATFQGNAPLNHMSALLQSIGQQVNQAQTQSLAAAAPPPSPSYSSPPAPPASFPQQRAVGEPATTAPSSNPLNAAAQVVAAHAAAATTGNMASSALLPNIQNWSLEQLENHVNLLQQMKQPVPQSVALLLADARRREEKKTAKRVANRKSACTSRARKKALVEEMTRTNARLRRQALILSLLPDLVIVISQEGEITFCSAQVERVLKHKIDDLIGSDIRDVLIPESRTALGKLVAELTNIHEKPGACNGDENRNQSGGRGDRNEEGPGSRRRENKPGDEENGDVSGASSGSGGLSSGAAAVVSDQSSFPLSVVKVDSKQEPPSDENDNSDASGGGGKEPVISSLSNSTARSPSASLANSGSGSEDGVRAPGTRKEDGDSSKKDRTLGSASKSQRPSSSDDSSSGSTETKNIRKANENLERNVRWHNKKMQSMSKSAKAKPGHKDDVLGDSVTPNNALARLSSLQHYPDTTTHTKKRKQFDSIGDRSSSEDSLLAGIEEKKKNSSTNNENASDDSGYRESNDSREETSSCASESSNSNGRNKPLAPTCNVCLIREDLTTLWCEVTSSIRTRSVEDESLDEGLPGIGNGTGSSKNAKGPAAIKSAGSKSSKASTISCDDTPADPKAPETKELLLCLRPIRDGDGKVDESLRFIPRNNRRAEESTSPVPSTGLNVHGVEPSRAVSAASNGDYSDPSCNPEPIASEEPSSDKKRHPKKRQLPLQSSTAQGAEACPESSTAKRIRVKGGPSSSSDTEKSVVESLMLMSHKSN